MLKHVCYALALLAPFSSFGLAAETATLKVTVSAGKLDRSNTPVRVATTLPQEWEKRKATVVLKDEKGTELPGQLTAPNLLAPPVAAAAAGYRCELNFILPKLEAGK